MQQKRDESDSMTMTTSNRHSSKQKSSGELSAASDQEKHSLSQRSTTELSAPAAASDGQQQSILLDSTRSKPERERWTREEYQSLINKALQEYMAAASSTTVTEAKDLQQGGLRGGGGGGGKSDDVVGAESAITTVDTNPLDRKPAAAAAARPRERDDEPGPIPTPHENDVLFGRSKHQKNHAGNQYLRKLCDEKRRVYDLADRDDKTEITRDLVKKIAFVGGRFLKFHKLQKVWVEVSEEEARLKVAHMVRDGRPQPLGRLEPEMFPPVR